MNTLPHDDTIIEDTTDYAPITGEHRLRPPVSLDAEPDDGVPVWEPAEGDFG